MAAIQLKITILAFYSIALVSLIAVPLNIFRDYRSGNFLLVASELIFLGFVFFGILFLWTQRNLVLIRLFFGSAIIFLILGLIVTGGGTYGIGLMYIIAGYPLLYYILGFRIGLSIPFLVFFSMWLRALFGNFNTHSIFNNPEVLHTFLSMTFAAAMLGFLAVAFQHLVLRSLHKAAYIDDTTGLSSKYSFEVELNERIQLPELRKKGFSIIGLKIIDFSTINSFHGNIIADKILSAIGVRLNRLFHDKDMVARYSGTVFLVLSAHTEFIDLEQIGKRILTAAQETIVIEGRTINLQGIVTITRFPKDGDTQELLIGNLIAGFMRMRNRNGTVSFYDEMLHRAETDRFTMIEELRQAIPTGELRLVYHPKVHLSTNTITGAEILLRWNSRLLGEIPPVTFIPLAEEAGLIQAISRWVVKTALEEVLTLSDTAVPLVHAVNLSPKDLADSDFRKFLWDILKSGNIKAGLVEFEITEGTMMDENPAIQHTLELIRKSGCRLAIDDFGTGYSSLSYLHRLQAHNLKIDRSFIMQINESNPVSPVVDAIISMALSLNMDITAEGVETPFQENYLKQRNCTYGQGYLYTKPIPLSEYQNMLKAR